MKNYMKNIERFNELLENEEVRKEIIDLYIEKVEATIDTEILTNITLNIDGTVDSYSGNCNTFAIHRGEEIIIARVDNWRIEYFTDTDEETEEELLEYVKDSARVTIETQLIWEIREELEF